MSEGKQWSCRWSGGEGAFEVWVGSRPSLRGRGASWQAALDDLCGEICESTGDGEPVLSFDPPPPVGDSDRRWISDRWALLTPNGCLPLADADPAEFTGGLCRHCGDPIGKRTGVPIKATGPAEGDLCATWYGFAAYDGCFFSERALQLLTPEERASADWYRVQPAPRTRKVMWECVPNTFLDAAAVRGWTTHGDQCPECGRRRFTCTSESEITYALPQLHEWGCAEDADQESAPLRGFGTLRRFSLLLPMDRARELARHPHARGALVGRIGLVPRSMVEVSPVLDVAHVLDSSTRHL
jgi:hypothetical protein